MQTRAGELDVRCSILGAFGAGLLFGALASNWIYARSIALFLGFFLLVLGLKLGREAIPPRPRRLGESIDLADLPVSSETGEDDRGVIPPVDLASRPDRPEI